MTGVCGCPARVADADTPTDQPVAHCRLPVRFLLEISDDTYLRVARLRPSVKRRLSACRPARARTALQ
jgi:hypothetical protein